MLKFFFWILLLANAGLLAYKQGYFEAMFPSNREPARMKEQLNADKVKLVPAPPPAPLPAPDPVKQPTPEQAPVQPVSSTESGAEPVAKKAETIACTEIGNFNPDDAKRFSAQIAALSLGERVAQRTIMEIANHMVYIPPQTDKDAAEKKAAELRNLGVQDFFIMQDNSSLRWGISLGVFKHEEAARAHLTALNQKGVRSARIGQRKVASNQVAFQLRELDTDAKAALDKIKTGFPKQEMRKCESA